MTADLLPFPKPSSKEAMDRPIDYDRLARLQGDVAAAHVRWWQGFWDEWQRFFRDYWARPW